MTALNIVSICVFLCLVVGLAAAYRRMRGYVRDAEGFIGIRSDAGLDSPPTAGGPAAFADASSQGDAVEHGASAGAYDLAPCGGDVVIAVGE